MRPVSIGELETAINAARASEPAQGKECTLSREVALLAEIYGILIFRHHQNFDGDGLDEPVRTVLRRWLNASGSTGEKSDRTCRH